MQPVMQHPWNITPTEALNLQLRLSSLVVKEDQLGPIVRIAGIDVAYHKDSDTLVASAVVVDAESLEVIEEQALAGKTSFPYVPGLFSFRELPSISTLLANLKCRPDLIICDGHGIAHPRRFGLASHLGVLYDIPTIGCGKSRYIGEYDMPLEARGCQTGLYDGVEQIGAVLRTQQNIKPVFVSIGHRISLKTACQWILKTTRKYRLPEATRLADRDGRQLYENRPSIERLG